MVARSRSVLQEQTVEVMEAVVWRCSSGGPWRSSGGACRGGRLEVLAVVVVWRRSLQVEGRPGAVQPNGCRTVRHGTAQLHIFSRLGELFRIKPLTCSHSNSEVF
ncbi:unnamed protein product [Boreogadus saida]